MPNPICPMQSVPPSESVTYQNRPILFGRSWYLFFSDMAKWLKYLLQWPNFIDMTLFFPGKPAIGAQVFNYLCPPRYNLGPIAYRAYLLSPATGTDLIFEVRRSANSSGTIPDTLMATGTFTVFFQNAAFVIVSDENHTVPDTSIYVNVTQVDGANAASDLLLQMRWEAEV